MSSKKSDISMRCFVAMPSGNHNEYEGGQEEANFIYSEIICPSIESIFPHAIITRDIDLKITGSIDKSIVQGIAESDIVVVDTTGLNPNVFFELGMRYVFRPNITILLTQNKEEIPFDINAYRVIEYSSKYFGPEKAKEEIASLLSNSHLSDNNMIDSLVYDVYPYLKVNTMPSIIARDKIMPWNFLMQHLLEISEKIDVLNTRMPIGAIIGLSNGGGIISEIIGRMLASISSSIEIPIISLWANRFDKSADYFNSPINHGVLKSLNIELGEKNMAVIIVDDVLVSGSTLRKANAIIEDYCSGHIVLTLPAFGRSKKYLSSFYKYSIWSNELIQEVLGDKNYSKNEYLDKMIPDFDYLPYGKGIKKSSNLKFE